MAKLQRFAAKIFGSGAGADQIGVFGSLFAGSEATTTDPKVAQSLSNWLTGWFGAAIGGNAPAIEDMNAGFFVTTYQIAKILQAGVAEWDAETTYFIGSFASDSLGGLYYSLTDDNLNHALSDTTNWKLYSSEPTGIGKDYFGSVLPAGYVWAAGKTIGNASSNATERANADTQALFTLLWNNYSNTLLPIYDSAGVASTRGANAAADFAANKALSLIDKRGRVSAGKDDMAGTTPAGRLTSATMIPDGVTLGAHGGEETHVLTEAELASHTHLQNSHNHTQDAHGHNIPMVAQPTGGGNFVPQAPAGSAGGTAGTAGTTATNQAATAVNQDTGSDDAHNNVQPTIVCNYIIKL